MESLKALVDIENNKDCQKCKKDVIDRVEGIDGSGGFTVIYCPSTCAVLIKARGKQNKKAA